jgi:hypothetical protein
MDQTSPDARHRGQPRRSRRAGWLLLAVAYAAISGGIATGQPMPIVAGVLIAATATYLLNGWCPSADRLDRGGQVARPPGAPGSPVQPRGQ